MMRSMISTASSGCWPDADSAESITASAPSYTAVETEFQVAPILRGERRQRNDRVGNVDALAVGELSANDDPRHRIAIAAAFDFEPELSIVEQQLQPGRHYREDLRVREAHALF